MTLAEISLAAQIVAALSVVVSLIFLVEVRQNTRSNRAATLQMNADYWLAYMTAMAGEEFSAIFSKGASAREDLTDAEFGRYFLPCRATLMGLENQHYQFRMGLIDLGAYQGYIETIREQSVAFPGFRAMWKIVRHTYGSEFVAFMDEQIETVEHHSPASAHRIWRAEIESEDRSP